MVRRGRSRELGALALRWGPSWEGQAGVGRESEGAPVSLAHVDRRDELPQAAGRWGASCGGREGAVVRWALRENGLGQRGGARRRPHMHMTCARPRATACCHVRAARARPRATASSCARGTRTPWRHSLQCSKHVRRAAASCLR